MPWRRRDLSTSGGAETHQSPSPKHDGRSRRKKKLVLTPIAHGSNRSEGCGSFKKGISRGSSSLWMRTLVSLLLLGTASTKWLATPMLRPDRQQERQLITQPRPDRSSRYVGAPAVRAVMETLDQVSGGLAFAVYDPKHLHVNSLEGRAFLLTNVPFFIAGARLIQHGQLAFGASLKLAGLLSHQYHSAQLRAPLRGISPSSCPETALSLLADYGGAAAAVIGTAATICARGGIAYLISRPICAACLALGALAFVGGCITDEERPWQYLAVHGAWHVLSAAACFQLASA